MEHIQMILYAITYNLLEYNHVLDVPTKNVET